MIEAKRRPGGLGRGLSALLGEAAGANNPGEGAINELAIDAIEPGEGQPRRHFEEAPLAELAESIRRHGVLQPIVTRRVGERYQIIAGERRWRAARLAGLGTIPTIVRDFSAADTLAVALIENVQREQLNAIEEGEAYARLIQEFGLTQEQVAAAVHKSRSHVANLMRLLDLHPDARTLLAQGKITMGHARALLAVEDQAQVASRIAAEGLTVRQVEQLARRRPRATPARSSAPASDDLVLLERQLGELLGLPVTIQHEGGGGGRVMLGYANLDQLDLICQRLTGGGI